MRGMILRRVTTLAATAALSAALAPAAQAATIYSTTLLGSNENPAVVTGGTGLGQLTLADDMNSFNVLINFSGLTSNAVAGHIHCCATANGNAGVAIGFTVPSAVAGTIMGTYDLTLASTYTSAFLMSSGGTAASAQATFLAGLGSGLTYLNIHTINNPGGEIRGQVGAVPEPATWAMMLAGFGMMGAGMRYRRRSTTTTFA